MVGAVQTFGSYSEGAGKKVERCAVAKKRIINTPLRSKNQVVYLYGTSNYINHRFFINR
jgi:hypothetical protein